MRTEEIVKHPRGEVTVVMRVGECVATGCADTIARARGIAEGKLKR